MTLASLLIGNRELIVVAAGVVAVGMVALIWSYVRSAGALRVRATAGVLKALALAALAMCLLEPLWAGTRPKSGANLFVLLADNSQSMQIKDPSASKNRGELLKELLTQEEEPWIVKLINEFDVRRYSFDSRLQNRTDFAELEFDGRASSIDVSLQALARRLKGRPLAGVLLFTDGNATDLPDENLDLSDLPPVYPVIVGKEEPARDIGILNIRVGQTPFEDAPVSIQVDVAAYGFLKEPLVARLLDESGKTVMEEIQEVREEGKPMAFRFQFRPEKVGVSFYTVEVLAKVDESEDPDEPTEQVEATPLNNRRMVVVDRGGGPYRVLYVSGRPNWEYKFLNRALQSDEQIDLVGYIRIAKREPKMKWRSGRGADRTNPFFRGFDVEDPEAAEQYDQPVMVRLNIKDETEEDLAELRDGFPKEAEKLYLYQAIIIDDLEAAFFTQDQMNLLKEYVSVRGGGLMMLGGQESFQRGGYDRTPIGEMLPVYLDQGPPNQIGEQYTMSLTREGYLQPWLRLRDNELDEKDRLAGMPPFVTMNLVGSIKPGASVLATVKDTLGQEYPALVVQRYGNGRTAALLAGDLWRWGLRDEPKDRDLEKAWRQMVRWLITDVPSRIQIDSEFQRDKPSTPVNIQVRVRDSEYKPLDNASMVVTIETPDKSELILDAEPSAVEAGLYETTYVPRDEGGYRARVTVTGGDGEEIGEAVTGWTANPAAEEFRSLSPNANFAATIAQRTGGEVVAADALEEFVDSLQNRKVPRMEDTIFPLWHTPLFFLFAIACLVAEWGLRRTKGLP